ncbi:MAG TPA: ribonucleotide-diphosphate reductase subunit beta [Jatrophihabitans sp.]|jgi:ribonucleoside-diphosphate reductase beta chain|uniref:ribonucleotide-diphosphate reductase subunit beta n=1 Tax=Jatrophihabitans sp. TaxID=1932789 RepID=UPI002EFF8ADC
MSQVLETEPGFVPDITDVGADAARVAKLATSADLYRRWERQQWLVAVVDPARDRATWDDLRPFVKQQTLNALAELEIGEVTVTRTLGTLIDNPPTEDDRIYLCTQLADEARHVRFFQTYLQEVCGVEAEAGANADSDVAADYASMFAPALTAVTGRLREVGSSPEDWYRALVYYHLITEGVLAATALRTTRFLARRLELSALDEGLTNVTRDESRHVSFGLRAAQDGVAQGYGQVIKDAHFESIAMAAWVLIGPARHNPSPAIRMALVSRAAQLQQNVDIAEERLVKQLRLIGMPELADAALTAWRQAIVKAIDGYEENWGSPHPIRAAARIAQN